MDMGQRDHLKAYGLTFWILENNVNVEWLLNYRGGTFMTDSSPAIEKECRIRGINYELINASETMAIYSLIEVLRLILTTAIDMAFSSLTFLLKI